MPPVTYAIPPDASVVVADPRTLELVNSTPPPVAMMPFQIRSKLARVASIAVVADPENSRDSDALSTTNAARRRGVRRRDTRTPKPTPAPRSRLDARQHRIERREAIDDAPGSGSRRRSG
jgi:hypothetical protein